ncbi:MAG: hypothetical protein WAS21_33115 [Geminicoccaceae bacterium]
MQRLGCFAVAADHPALPGHFPGHPIVPGVVLLDEALAAIDRAFDLAAPFRLLRVKFMAPVGSGQEVTVMAAPPAQGTVRFSCMADGRPVLSAVVRFGAPDKEPLT